MLQALASAWWAFLLRGIASALLGVTIWFQPAASVAVPVLFGIALIVLSFRLKGLARKAT